MRADAPYCNGAANFRSRSVLLHGVEDFAVVADRRNSLPSSALVPCERIVPPIRGVRLCPTNPNAGRDLFGNSAQPAWASNISKFHRSIGRGAIVCRKMRRTAYVNGLKVPIFVAQNMHLDTRSPQNRGLLGRKFTPISPTSCAPRPRRAAQWSEPCS
jgi:hypothetical protein